MKTQPLGLIGYVSALVLITPAGVAEAQICSMLGLVSLSKPCSGSSALTHL